MSLGTVLGSLLSTCIFALPKLLSATGLIDAAFLKTGDAENGVGKENKTGKEYSSLADYGGVQGVMTIPTENDS